MSELAALLQGSPAEMISVVETVLPWQRSYWHEFQQALVRGRLPHALLLAGASGLGKQALAAAMGAHLLCEHRDTLTEGQICCGQCHSCAMRKAGSHPDLLVVAPAEQGKLIRIDTVRSVNDFMSQTAQQGGYRVIMLSGADAMTVGAANALLKTLEEPGERTLFVLTSDLPSRVLPTILSRCQRWTLKHPHYDECAPWLTAQLDNAEEARFWWRIADGAPLRAVRCGRGEWRQLRQKMIELFDALVRGAEPVAEASRLDKQPLLDVLEIGIAWLEDLIRFGLSGEEQGVRNADVLPLYRQAVKNGRVRDWYRLLDYAHEQRRLVMSGSNPNPMLVLEAWLVRWAALLRS